MYESWFRFTHRPFMTAPNIHHYYPAEGIEASRNAVISCIQRGAGPALVVGPTGTGKTVLGLKLQQHFQSMMPVALVAGSTCRSIKELLQNTLYALGLPYDETDEGQLRLSLSEFFRSRNSAGRGNLLIVDEAGLLTPPLLEELQGLSNLTSDDGWCLHLVMLGTGRLEESLAIPALDSLNQRIATRCYLTHWNRADTESYIRRQTHQTGAAECPFEESAIQKIYEVTDGVPRLINQISDHGLVLAAAGNQPRLDDLGIAEAWSDLQHLPPPTATIRSEDQMLPDETIIEFGTLDDGRPITSHEQLADTPPCVLEETSRESSRCDSLAEEETAGDHSDNDHSDENAAADGSAVTDGGTVADDDWVADSEAVDALREPTEFGQSDSGGDGEQRGDGSESFVFPAAASGEGVDCQRNDAQDNGQAPFDLDCHEPESVAHDWPDGEGVHDDAPHHEVPYDEVPHDEAPHDEVPHDEVPNHEIPHEEVPHDEALHDVAPHDDAPHDVAPHEVAPHDEAPHENALHHEGEVIRDVDCETYSLEPLAGGSDTDQQVDAIEGVVAEMQAEFPEEASDEDTTSNSSTTPYSANDAGTSTGDLGTNPFLEDFEEEEVVMDVPLGLRPNPSVLSEPVATAEGQALSEILHLLDLKAVSAAAATDGGEPLATVEPLAEATEADGPALSGPETACVEARDIADGASTEEDPVVAFGDATISAGAGGLPEMTDQAYLRTPDFGGQSIISSPVIVTESIGESPAGDTTDVSTPAPANMGATEPARDEASDAPPATGKRYSRLFSRLARK